MSAKEKIEIILNDLRIKAPTFAKKINVPYSRIYDIQRGKTNEISGEVANAIAQSYPQYNISWLLSGEGDMVKSKDASNAEVKGDMISMPREVFDQIARLTETVLSQQRVIESQNGTIGTLIEGNKKTATPNSVSADDEGSVEKVG